jgi:hypothetical protein
MEYYAVACVVAVASQKDRRQDNVEHREGQPDIYFVIMEGLNEGRNETKIKLKQKQKHNKEWDDSAARVC